ncbi:YncE family protein [Streptomyces sp. HSW2009]|uniref:YncE family protein n=1 Tax=Streptomyces sp. HSW2009 TaxID=3142890 RepID=UPI0032EC421F
MRPNPQAATDTPHAPQTTPAASPPAARERTGSARLARRALLGGGLAAGAVALASWPAHAIGPAAAPATPTRPTSRPARRHTTPTGDVLAVVQKSGHALAFHDTASGELLARIPLERYPHEVVADSARRYAYVGHYGVRMSADPGPGGTGVWMVDLRARQLVRTLSTDPFRRIHGLAIDRHDRLYALPETDAVLLGYDEPRTATAPSRTLPTGGAKTHLLTVSPDGERAYVTGLDSGTVSLLHPHDPTAPPVVATPGPRPEGCCLSADGRTLYVGVRGNGTVVALDATTLAVTGSYDTAGGDPLRVYAAGPAAPGLLLVTDIVRRTLTLLDPALRPVATIALAGVPSALSLHPHRPLAYVSELDTGRVTLVDLERRCTTGGFAVDGEPDSSILLPAPASGRH